MIPGTTTVLSICTSIVSADHSCCICYIVIQPLAKSILYRSNSKLFEEGFQIYNDALCGSAA
ncbi:hypothetical protein PR003_g26588 [Phytophthora rubi]|uniref:Uncharacterized protein n=1 Tax=Phytophthora rubi TaxID=129364 RepID=A0A6A3IF18_9STRA|nr:hypothetical protein PR001_g29005 [Phytophthora rubi]KAE8980062.1 hypothetical protein PR002_g24239 [Phytophthora rubi]KAE9285409.1 hypothetical protein PR003_g26588 [Phytophthora rubi]